MNPYDAPAADLQNTTENAKSYRFSRFVNYLYLVLFAIILLLGFIKNIENYGADGSLAGAIFALLLIYAVLSTPLFFFLKTTKKGASTGLMKVFKWNICIAILLLVISIARMPLGQQLRSYLGFVVLAFPHLVNSFTLFRTMKEK